MRNNSEPGTTQPDNAGSTMAPAGVTLAELLENASAITFVEGRAPYVMDGMKVSPVDVPPVTREDIENFVRVAASKTALEKLDVISRKSRDDYSKIDRDEIHFSISTEKFAYRGSYEMSRHGATLLIRRVPKHSNFSVSHDKQLDVESPTNQLQEL